MSKDTKFYKTPEDLIERSKKILFLKGRHTSQSINDIMKDLVIISKPNNKTLTRKNDILPFEDPNSLEFLGPKNDCGMFALFSHSKKRPNNMVLGRLFDGHVLDLFEFGVDSFQSLSEFQGDKKAVGSKPLMIFLGDQWEQEVLYKNIQSSLLDFFRGFKPDKINLRGVDHVITCAVSDDKIYVRMYVVHYKKSSSEVPELVLKPMGPFLDLSVRRTQMATEDLWSIACKKPKIPGSSKVKNISRTDKGDKVARIHMKKQNLDSMGGRRMKALRNTKRSIGDDEHVAKNSKRAKTA